MRVALLALTTLVALTGCGGRDKPAPVLLTPTSRLIQADTEGHGIWTLCDRHNLVYLNHGGSFQVVPNGCPTGEP